MIWSFGGNAEWEDCVETCGNGVMIFFSAVHLLLSYCDRKTLCVDRFIEKDLELEIPRKNQKKETSYEILYVYPVSKSLLLNQLRKDPRYLAQFDISHLS